MKADNRTKGELLSENKALETRLEEAEELLQAIRTGAVDAIVVSIPEGDQVYTLKGADYPYRMLVESMSDGAALLSPDGSILYCNRQLVNMLRVPMETLISSPLAAYVASANQGLFTARLESQTPGDEPVEISFKTGLPVLFSCHSLELAGRRVLSVVFTDISSQKQAELKIQRLNQLYQVSTMLSHAIALDNDRDAMFREFCRIAVKPGGFRLAWVGLTDQQTGLVNAFAAEGETGFLDGLRITINDEPEGMEPVARSIRHADYSLCNDFLNDEGTRPLHEKARIYGLLAMASVAIKENNEVIGAFNLHAGEKDYFDSQQIELLQQMGCDISLALDKQFQRARLQEADTLQIALTAENKLIEEAARISHLQFKEIFNQSPIGIALIDSFTGQISEVNSRFVEIAGRTIEETAQIDWMSITHPDDVQADLDNMALLNAGKISGFTMEKRYIRPDGSIVWVSMTISPLIQEGNVSPRHLCMVMDITGRKEIEANNIQHLAAIVTSSDDAIISKSLEGIVTTWNHGAETLFGYLAKEIIGHPIRVIIPPDRQDEEDAILGKIKAGETVAHYETKRLRKDATLIDVSTTNSPIRDGNGHIIGVSKIARDITERKKLESEIRFKDRRYKAIFDQAAPDAIFIHDHNGCIIEVNEQACNYTGYSRAELLAMSVWDLEQDFDVPAAQALWSSIEPGIPTKAFGQQRRKDGSKFPVEIHFGLLELEGERLYVGVVQDITERKQTESSLKLAASVYTHTHEGIMITDAAGDIVDVNDAFTYITGYPREEILSLNPRFLKSGRHEPEFYASLWQNLATTGHWYGEIWNRRKNGETYAELLTISAVQDAYGRTENYIALFTDITPIKEHQQQLEHIAHYDSLTGLPNRLLFSDRLRQTMARTQRRGYSQAVVYLDLDGFKEVNDSHGHLAGDQLLIAIAQRMKAALREVDTLARFGGDEFVAILVDLEQPQDCEPLLTRLLLATANPVTVGQTVLRVSASIGVTLYPQDDSDADQLLRHADQAMYLAKQSGKNRYHLFDVNHDIALKSGQKNLDNMTSALKRHEFVLHYQPKVNMKTGAVIGAEALIRWQHPEQGLLPPADFLPFIKNHPFCLELGEWVIDTAFAQLAEWQALGLEIPVSVNIDAYHLQQDGFALRMRERFAASPAVRPGHFELEILESSALEDVNNASNIMQACCDVGVHFALDDFGTGYSSLSHLKHLPVEVLKIDQSFVRDMLNNPNDRSIVEGVIGLANAFHHQVIAEGVETVGQGDLLLTFGCDLAQGYAIARAMPGTQLPGWAATWQQDPVWVSDGFVS